MAFLNSAGVLGASTFTLALALAFALPLALAAGVVPASGGAVEFATSTNARREGPPAGLPLPELPSGISIDPTIEASPSAVLSIAAVAEALILVLSRSAMDPPLVAQNRTDSGSSGASGPDGERLW